MRYLEIKHKKLPKIEKNIQMFFKYYALAHQVFLIIFHNFIYLQHKKQLKLSLQMSKTKTLIKIVKPRAKR